MTLDCSSGGNWMTAHLKLVFDLIFPSENTYNTSKNLPYSIWFWCLMLSYVLFDITCIQHVGGSPKEEVYIYKKKNDWKVRQHLFGKLFRQTPSNRWVEKWDKFFSENHLDKQPQTYELKSETTSFQQIISTNNLKHM